MKKGVEGIRDQLDRFFQPVLFRSRKNLESIQYFLNSPSVDHLSIVLPFSPEARYSRSCLVVTSAGRERVRNVGHELQIALEERDVRLAEQIERNWDNFRGRI